ncbi:MAG: hypothetical protein A3A08_00960 [Candidatus Nealsonbacteria bacterium RIFCSPLOWO2_01_FULL_41_9]|uniref:Uncharacterized protein n=1 Tax=Candidatus Nealsonbacteria bacterium RIFCSPLOWO2_01_FULL_41_9 TaxID=1801671 RepID=A0A1G2EDT1_9BACT|nr:MAG: hypothetical protein A3A08_00960 [Candidatus Nealsonbacteria bacterium RIFCSPLOWO2_01_FULL_41_9]
MATDGNSFIVVTVNNIEEISGMLAEKKGKILIAEPGPASWAKETVDVSMSLFDHPLIDLKGYSVPFLNTERGREERNGVYWQTGWENDRYYLLRPKPKKSADSLFDICRSLEDRLILGGYEFSIGFQSSSGASLFPNNGEVLYFSNNNDLRAVMLHGLNRVINQMDSVKTKRSLLKAAGQIADYAVEDFKTNKIFKHNVSAGMEADSILGM